MTGPPPHERYTAHLSRTPSPNKDPDAGLRGLGHYERRLPAWRFRLRQHLIPIVRWETPYLAYLQDRLRTPWLDTYFALSANLGTHTFFMTALPICFWCGYPDAGIALVHMLAMGVYLSGAVKDLVCLPRPLSPPLHRITMSGSAALEYGFPSTHTTNAVSVAGFCLWQLWRVKEAYEGTEWAWYVLCLGCFAYASSITIGRMYCGMHGFFDVLFGGLLGAWIAWARISFGAAFDAWVLADGWTRPAMVVAALGVAVRINPEPADNCPCFDDSVAFIGVVMGAEIAIWHYAGPTHVSGAVTEEYPLAAARYPFTNNDLLISLARVIGGIVVVFLWRAIMKPVLLRCLPPIFRFVDHFGVNLPRRYFLQARDYKNVPSLRKDDNVIPPASEISNLVSNLRTRKRTVSIGPQSEADAREFIANREQRRRDSIPNVKIGRKAAASSEAIDEDRIEAAATARLSQPRRSYLDAGRRSEAQSGHSRSRSRHQQHATHLQVSAPPDPNLLTPPASDNGASSDSGKEDDRKDREMFGSLEKPRIRYDVEVITKLVVYAGIAWLAIEGNPLWFERFGMV